MVKITGYKQFERENGEKFFVLQLMGKPEIVKSLNTGKPYMTTRRATMSCTFDEDTCKSLIGETFVGSIRRVACEPYEFVAPQTGEVIKLDFRYEYCEEAETMEETVLEQA